MTFLFRSTIRILLGITYENRLTRIYSFEWQLIQKYKILLKLRHYIKASDDLFYRSLLFNLNYIVAKETDRAYARVSLQAIDYF